MPKDGDIKGWSVARADLASVERFGLGRRTDLDWLRVIAFGLLILFHVALVYAPFDWHIHSNHTADWMRLGIFVTGPWRLTLLFLISGAALRLMSRRKTAGEVLGARLKRLAPPALFGILVLVPPQAFIEASTKGWWTGDFFGWWLHEFTPQGLADGLPVNHVWFVLYIGLYSLLATALVALPRLAESLGRGVERVLLGPGLLVAPVAYLFVARQGLFLHYGISNHVTDDWYNHAVSLGAFMLGYLVVGRSSLWERLVQWRWASLAVAGVSLPVLVGLNLVPETVPEPWWTSLVFAADQWATIAAILGFGARHLSNRDGPLLRYLTQAVFPCYLAHQTILVGATWIMRGYNLPAPVEATSLTAITVVGCLATYEVVRRLNWLRPLFGLKPLARTELVAAKALRPSTSMGDRPGIRAEAA